MTRTIRLRAPTTTGTVSVGGVEHQIVEDHKSAIRGRAFAAGYRCAQIENGYGEPLVDWELDEARNAIAQGFTSAERCLRPKP